MNFLKELLRELKYGLYEWRHFTYAIGIGYLLLGGLGLYYGPWLAAAKAFFLGAWHMCLYYKSLEWSAKP